MRTLTVINNLTLDGVVQGPASVAEDPRGGFRHGGWTVPYNDAVLAEVIGPRLTPSGGGAAFLFGRRTYEGLRAAWQGRTDNPFSAILDAAPKYVPSNTLSQPEWAHTTTLRGDARESVAALKATQGPDLMVFGSGELLHTLVPAGLVDLFVLMIYPVVLGSGARMFGPADTPVPLQLTETTATSSGVIVATYRSA